MFVQKFSKVSLACLMVPLVSVVIYLCLTDMHIKTHYATGITHRPTSTAKITQFPYRLKTRTDISKQFILDCLVDGKWIEKPFTKEQEEQMRIFFWKSRDEYNLPHHLQRRDNRCGNISFATNLKWFRAVCDPDGSTPCCFYSYCRNLPKEICTCKRCYDLRQQLYAELSTWKHTNYQCELKRLKKEEACNILGDMNITFIGDSFMRHMYMGLQIILTGNDVNGCMAENLTKEIGSKCSGLYMFTVKICKKHYRRVHVLCGDRVQISLVELYSSHDAPKIIKTLSRLTGQPNSLIVMGLGVYDRYNATTMISKVLSPVLNLLKSRKNESQPKLLWIGVHSPGLLKTLLVPEQLYPKRLLYNKAMRQFLESNSIPVMETVNLTRGVASPDGSHYGKGVNVLKAQVLLNYLSIVRNVRLDLYMWIQ